MSMMEKASDNNKNSIFKMTDLRTLCKARITELGWRWLERIHTTKLKNRLLVYFESLTEFKNGKNTLLVFGSAVSSALKKIRMMMTNWCLKRQMTPLERHFFKKSILHLMVLSNKTAKNILYRRSLFNEQV